MVRKRSDTIGDLGRLPARPSSVGIPVPPPAPEPSRPQRGVVAGWIHGALFDNVGLKFLSVVLAITVFLLVSTDKDREMTVHLRVSYTLPADRVLVSGRLDDVRVTLKGPQRLLRKFDEHSVDINLDLREAIAGDVSITPDLVHLPPGLSVADLSPRVVRVAFDKLTEKTVPIAPDVGGTPKHGYWVAELKAQPATARIRGAEKVIVAQKSISTKQINLADRAESFTVSTQLVPTEGVELVGTPDVAVAVQIEQQLITRTYTNLTVGVRGDGADKWTTSPEKIDVTLIGTTLAVERAKADLALFVRVAPADKVARVADVAADGLPPGVGMKLSQERVKLVPVAPPAH
ncbi:MAG TPA: CdaR family protein [Kofleriaceae bacterium]|jgi:YbbR domain-containing protein